MLDFPITRRPRPPTSSRFLRKQSPSELDLLSISLFSFFSTRERENSQNTRVWNLRTKREPSYRQRATSKVHRTGRSVSVRSNRLDERCPRRCVRISRRGRSFRSRDRELDDRTPRLKLATSRPRETTSFHSVSTRFSSLSCRASCWTIDYRTLSFPPFVRTVPPWSSPVSSLQPLASFSLCHRKSRTNLFSSLLFPSVASLSFAVDLRACFSLLCFYKFSSLLLLSFLTSASLPQVSSTASFSLCELSRSLLFCFSLFFSFFFISPSVSFSPSVCRSPCFFLSFQNSKEKIFSLFCKSSFFFVLFSFASVSLTRISSLVSLYLFAFLSLVWVSHLKFPSFCQSPHFSLFLSLFLSAFRKSSTTLLSSLPRFFSFIEANTSVVVTVAAPFSAVYAARLLA